MIIQCQSCEKQFQLDEADLLPSGRLVQCGYCSKQWFQLPARSVENIDKQVVDKKNKEEKPTLKDFKASNGKNYRFLGMQWAELLPSGKLGMLATKKISKELDKLAGRKTLKKTNKTTKKNINPSEGYNQKRKNEKNNETSKGLGFFGYIFLLIIIFLSLLGVIETFKENILIVYPEIDNQLNFIYEAFENILILVKDIFKQY